jgi:hypothetical protein
VDVEARSIFVYDFGPRGDVYRAKSPIITSDLSSVSPPPQRTADYVDSVCVAIYGLKLIAMILAGKEPGIQNVPLDEKVRRTVLWKYSLGMGLFQQVNELADCHIRIA